MPRTRIQSSVRLLITSVKQFTSLLLWFMGCKLVFKNRHKPHHCGGNCGVWCFTSDVSSSVCLNEVRGKTNVWSSLLRFVRYPALVSLMKADAATEK